ncbi:MULTISPECIES: hypothetical protein [Haloarcula]|uniref:hypothetical protein n=1 Tax=Haloarcula TaxID=2237 RepID=UPI0023EC7B44|nr:hypothetical protein [Halomicroarcula sp. XH51]
MSSTKASETTETYIVDAASDPDVKLTLIDDRTGKRYHVVDFADDVVREKLQVRGPGKTVRVDMVPLDPERTEWQVTRLLPGSLPRVGTGLRR